MKETDLDTDLYLGDEIIFNLLLLSDLLCLPGAHILPYIEQVQILILYSLRKGIRKQFFFNAVPLKGGSVQDKKIFFKTFFSDREVGLPISSRGGGGVKGLNGTAI